MYRDVAQKCNALVLPAHPLSNEKPIVYNYTDGFNAIDWETMELTQGVLGYNSQIRMAECLIKDKVDISKMKTLTKVDIAGISNEDKDNIKNNINYMVFSSRYLITITLKQLEDYIKNNENNAWMKSYYE